MEADNLAEVTLSVGPQHPGSGHFRLVVSVDGDTITKASPDPGYVHRGVEKQAEYREYLQSIPLLERPVISDSNGSVYGYVLAVEKLAGLVVPERAQYIRVLMAELNRIASHLYWLAIYGIFLGHSTMFMWPFGDREAIIDLAQRVMGTRLTYSYFVPGGVRTDVPVGFRDQALPTLEFIEKRLPEYEAIFVKNPVFHKRTKGVGVLKEEDAIKLGVVGPTLRGSGVNADARKDEPYDAYDKVDFDVPTFPDGDCLSRSLVRIEEIRQSIRIVRQVLDSIPQGAFRTKGASILKPPHGSVYARAEAARGTFAYFITSTGNKTPYRLKISSPSFRNLPAFEFLMKGSHLADMPTIYWSLDYWPLEADR
jgi:NADH-quinone oxidoreductase subunit D